MRGTRVLPLVLGVLGACVTGPSDPSYGGYPDPGPDPGSYPPDPGTEGGFCSLDADCNPGGGSAYVCSRVGDCLPPSEVRDVHVLWTVSNQSAGSASCVNAPDLELMLGQSDYYSFGWAPVPCIEGEFTVLNMPIDYTYVSLIRENDQYGGSNGVFDGSGNVNLNLPY